MWYIRLSFKNAKLKKEGSGYKSSFKDIDIDNPIGVNQVSNMLHVMFGLPPKPSKRKTVFERNETIYNIAKEIIDKNYIRYTYKGFDEFFITAKGCENSNINTEVIFNGKLVKGHYTWNYFDRCFIHHKNLYIKIMSFFEDVIGCKDIKKHYTMEAFIKEFHKHLNDNNVIQFKRDNKCLYAKGKGSSGDPLKAPWWGLIFNEDFTGSNLVYNSYTPVLNAHGIGKVKSYDGEIVVPIEDEELLYKLKQYGTLPTILDGGVVNVISVTRTCPFN
jgi:hypothetical protein